jgi:hypothetical protein
MSKHEGKESKRHEAAEYVRGALKRRTRTRRENELRERNTPRQSFAGKPASAGAMNVRGGPRKKS